MVTSSASSMQSSKASSAPTKPSGPPTKQPAVASETAAVPSWADRARLGPLRKSTPDSEALASDDDEHDIYKITRTISNTQPQPPQQPPAKTISQRRTSWLSEIHSGFPQRASLAANNSNTSQPVTPSSESNPWPIGVPLGRVSSSPTTSSTWSSTGLRRASEQRRDPTSRYLDVASPVLSGSIPVAEQSSMSSGGASSSFPFHIPLHPTPKTYRSQSYSVGQAESNAAAQAAANPSFTQQAAPLPPSAQSRQRIASQQSLWNRPSRPSMLSEVHQGSSNMSALHEETDDFDTPFARHADRPVPSRSSISTQGGIEAGQPDLLHMDSSSHSSYSFIPSNNAQSFPPTHNSGGELDESADDLTRRFSELTGLGRMNSGKSPWQSSLGFDDQDAVAQGRRHSMAQIPIHRSFHTNAGAAGGNQQSSTYARPTGAPEQLASLDTSFRQLSFRGDQRIDPIDEYAVSPTSAPQHDPQSAPALMGAPYSTQVRASQHPHGIFSRPGQDTSLFLVSFKGSRADVYFVASNTGLHVAVGDDVIVEADRGHDLGTVQYAGLPWAQAREVKKKANEDHFRWLMLQSHNPKTAAAANSAREQSTASASDNGRDAFDMSSSPLDPSHSADLKPKMIKRLAQPHETATRRDKEGNEAKARRLCQQKVVEHGIDMEILDAEFQMDWKKLTFYYYAHSYVNFNILVTELFKVYKTRIWMSAVNPASLSSPVVGSGASNNLDSVAHRVSPTEASAQDLDPTGAIPPNMNPATSAFYEYAYATRQSAAPPAGHPSYRQQYNAPLFPPMSQTEYMMQPAPTYWPETSESLMGHHKSHQQQYNAAAASYNPQFQHQGMAPERHTISPYQQYGGRPEFAPPAAFGAPHATSRIYGEEGYKR